MLGQGFEPWSSARKANMIGRTTPTERRISDEEWPLDKSVFFGRGQVTFRNSKRAPPPSLSATATVQPCAVATSSTMPRPMPVPSSAVV